MFKGTTKRPSTLIISQELDGIGADYNAFTSKDRTGYYIKAESASLEKMIDMLSDITTNSLFVPEEIDKERGAILEEINMYEDNPMAKVGDLFEEDLFGKTSSLGRHVIGTKRNIKMISRESLINYWQKHYHAQNIVIAAAGRFNQEKAILMLEEKFGSIKKGKRNNSAASPSQAYAKGSFSAHCKKTSQAHVVLGFPGVHNEHKDRYSLALLSIILGGNMSSRLFIKVREQLGLCYFIRASCDTMEDAGSFSIQAGLDLKKLSLAFRAISEELRLVKSQKVPDSELNKSKQFIKGKMALSQEDSMDMASFFGSQKMFNKKVITPDEVFKQIEKISSKNIQKAAQQYLDLKKLQATSLSPIKDINKFAKIFDF